MVLLDPGTLNGIGMTIAMASVRKTSLLLRRSAAALTLIAAGLPALAGGWNGFFVLAGKPPAESAQAPEPGVPGLMLGVSWKDSPGAAQLAEAAAPRLRAGFGTRTLQGFMSLAAPAALTGAAGAEDSGFGLGVSYAPTDALQFQGELRHRDAPDAAADGWQQRLQLSASFRF